MDNKWTPEWPKEEGLFWFYGYRWGKVSCGREMEKELKLVNVWKTGGNSLTYICDGGFMYKSEVEEPMFQRVIPPKLPKTE